ncbi:MarR family winged helix-turn-helix transcriptional regulator [Agromyces larvae]|uniref:MarR family transcriptional regulator n=1 Tax=Agromyces larvae TaxID=2929802 RepID=A0ABY4BVL1_9MICO|nr:MarR family transcriptional regulator [Agromyces larvae]UOE43253.1 MarR family transcriptional regulator [Agromyces larvae]
MEDEGARSAADALARLAFLTNARLEARAAEVGEGLSVQQLRLLGILRDREPTINELTVLLGVDKSSVSGLVIRAERRGLVSRTRHERDGRAVRVRLEGSGRTLIDAATASFELDVQQLLAVLTDAERARWVALTNRVLSAEADQLGLTP